jgi:hypothetical protein
VALHNLLSSLDIIRMMKSRRIRLTKHVTYIIDKKNEYKSFGGKAERNHSEDLDVDGRILLKWI